MRGSGNREGNLQRDHDLSVPVQCFEVREIRPGQSILGVFVFYPRGSDLEPASVRLQHLTNLDNCGKNGHSQLILSADVPNRYVHSTGPPLET